MDQTQSPNKRPKTLTLDPQISPSSSKGKTPVDDELSDDDSPADSPQQNCGICFSDEGKSVRGLIDCCNHFFCFLCIIEWSRIESRCPLCRGRFGSIRRVRRDGSFIGEGCVRVPVRDQIYDPFGEAVDPYAQAKCAVCNGNTDESLLLLCDLCDSAWHTYCVGLGVTVPEGDWYCRDCSLLRTEESNAEMEDKMDSSANSKDVDGAPSTSAAVSIFDIVRDEEPDTSVERLLKLVSPPSNNFSSSSFSSGKANIANIGSLQGAKSNFKAPADVMESSARTLRNCRNVHRHISVLRENWDSFRTGSLTFSSNLMDSSGKGHIVAKCKNTSSKLQSSTTSLQSKAEYTSCNAGPNKQSYNVDRAWKLMSRARSMQQVGQPKVASKTMVNKAHNAKADNVGSKCVIYGSKDVKSTKSGMRKPSVKANGKISQTVGQHQVSIAMEAGSTSVSKYQDSYVSRLSSSGKVQNTVEDIYHKKPGLLSLRKVEKDLSTLSDNVSSCSSSLSGSKPGAFKKFCSKFEMKEISTCPVEQVGSVSPCITSKAELQTSVHVDTSHDQYGLLSQHNLGVSSNVVVEQKDSAFSKPLYEPVKGASGASCLKFQRGEMSKCANKGGTQTVRKTSKSEEAKKEIQALVKLNLKLLSKHKRLGADAFKEIARTSTHTILAACGFEHREIVHSYPTLVCRHVDQIKPIQMSTLMPSSCRECFYHFVKDVVNLIMSEKLNVAGVC